MKKEKDPMGHAIADYWQHGTAGRLRVFSPDFEEDEIPVDTLFRTLTQMPVWEQKALEMAHGSILDVGAGAGCHSLALQEMGKTVTAIDLSPHSVETMRQRGVKQAEERDFWTLQESYDTVLMLMNGIGIVGSEENLPRFFQHIDELLAPQGQLLFDSSDLRYLYDEDDEAQTTDGLWQLQYQMQYKRTKGEPFNWLYISYEKIKEVAEAHGFVAELIKEGEHYEYLARLQRKVR